MTAATLDDVRMLDRADPLAALRDRFALPAGIIYLDGNSLGPLPKATIGRLKAAVGEEWGHGLVGSWNDRDWIGAPARIGDKIAQLVGAEPGEVIVADSTSVNLYKLSMAAAALKPEGRDIVTEVGNFPTDIYVASGVAKTLGLALRAVDRDALLDAITPGTALVVLTHVDYRSGYKHDIVALNEHAARCGTRIVWDLSHSIGAVRLDMKGEGVELAVGCGYKHLNGGPGAPAFLYVATKLQDQVISPIAGWFGHRAPFDFDDRYEPSPGISKFLAGTPPILSLLALEAGVDLMLDVNRDALFAKGAQLFALFQSLVAERCPGLMMTSPTDPSRRGGHITFVHENAHAIVQALIERGVIGDFRAPDVIRFGITPLHSRFEDAWRAVDILHDILTTQAWRDPRYSIRRGVT